MLHRRVKIQLAVFIAVALVFGAVMLFGYMKAPARWFGIGQYNVVVELPTGGGLYKRGNVTYRGTKVGRVEEVRLTDTGGVEAVLRLDSGIDIPSDLDAEVHSVSAIGELYVQLLPRNGDSPPLRNGDVIPVDRASVPPDINSLLDATNTGLEAIPRDNLKTAIDEAYIAIGGLGPEIRRFVQASTQLAIDARENLDPMMALIDQAQPVFDSQSDTSDAIRAWAANLAVVTEDLQTHDASVSGVFNHAPAFDELSQFFDRLQPTLPIIAANLLSVGEVAVTYQPALEQLLVLIPHGTSALQAIAVANKDTKQDYKGLFLDFNLNLNLPPACTTGFLPAQQKRPTGALDFPDRPAGDLYCRVPQDHVFNVRGARNYPCITRPGKRAPTVKMCESDQEYVPLNDGWNWKGDPNATLSGQDIPQLPPDAPAPGTAPPAAPPPPMAAAEYNPATGTYIGPDGQVHTQSNLAQTAPKDPTWQDMLLPPTG